MSRSRISASPTLRCSIPFDLANSRIIPSTFAEGFALRASS
jgi:hypothetical protein